MQRPGSVPGDCGYATSNHSACTALSEITHQFIVSETNMHWIISIEGSGIDVTHIKSCFRTKIGGYSPGAFFTV